MYGNITDDLPSASELARRHGEEIRRMALRLTRSESAAQDIAQDVLVRVISRGGFDSTRASLDRWLRIVTRNTAIDWVRREAAHQQRLVRIGALHSASTVDVEDTVTERVQAIRVRAAVAELPDDEREVVSLAYFGGLSYRQVADQLGLAEGTVKSRIRRALTRMAHMIGTDSIHCDC
jgi:RNA polymerase sigma factor (sigma-70 family)